MTNIRLRPDGLPCYVRKGETIGGGLFVFRRGKIAGRIKPSHMPFEYRSLEEALGGLKRLNEKYPDESFEMFITLDVANQLAVDGVFDHSIMLANEDRTMIDCDLTEID